MEDKGRWIQLDSSEEEQILERIGVEYIPPERRNLSFIVGKSYSSRIVRQSF
jgi:DNA polymerase/3'-5' exonuclease PolX